MIAGWLSVLSDLVIPNICAGCAADPCPTPLCADCQLGLAGPAWRAESGAGRLIPADGGPPLACWAAGSYEGSLRQAVGLWKRAGRRDLDQPFGKAMTQLGQQIAPAIATVATAIRNGQTFSESADNSVAGNLIDGLTAGADQSFGDNLVADGLIGDRCLNPVLLVPVPSRLASQLKRGSLVAILAKAVAEGLKTQQVAARVATPLRRRFGSRDQVGLPAIERAANRHAATALKTTTDLAGRAVILVDDIVTTGASLLEAERLLASHGAAVLGAAVLAATPPVQRQSADSDCHSQQSQSELPNLQPAFVY